MSGVASGVIVGCGTQGYALALRRIATLIGEGKGCAVDCLPIEEKKRATARDRALAEKSGRLLANVAALPEAGRLTLDLPGRPRANGAPRRPGDAPLPGHAASAGARRLDEQDRGARRSSLSSPTGKPTSMSCSPALRKVPAAKGVASHPRINS